MNPGAATKVFEHPGSGASLKVTVPVCGNGTLPSVTSTAEYVMVSLFESTALKSILPLESVTGGLGPAITELPPVCEIWISLPGVGRPRESCSVTVMSAGVLPSAVTWDGPAVRLAPAAGGTTKSTVWDV